MSKPFLVLALASVLAFTWAFASPAAGVADEREAVEAAVRDYVEGLYRAEPARIERSVSPELEKYGLYRPDGEKDYRSAGKMSFDRLRELAATWNANDKQGTDLTYEIQVLYLLDRTASAKLVAKWGIDYFHLVRSDDGWKILQIVWQSHPPRE
jgi:hypothetical protein